MATDIHFVGLDEWKASMTAPLPYYYGTGYSNYYDYKNYWKDRDWYPYYLTGGNWEVEKLLMDTEVFEMYVYNIILVDTEKCEVVQRYEDVVAESEKVAMLEIDLGPNQKVLLKKGKLKFIFNLVGGFNRFKKSEE